MLRTKYSEEIKHIIENDLLVEPDNTPPYSSDTWPARTSPIHQKHDPLKPTDDELNNLLFLDKESSDEEGDTSPTPWGPRYLDTSSIPPYTKILSCMHDEPFSSSHSLSHNYDQLSQPNTPIPHPPLVAANPHPSHRTKRKTPAIIHLNTSATPKPNASSNNFSDQNVLRRSTRIKEQKPIHSLTNNNYTSSHRNKKAKTQTSKPNLKHPSPKQSIKKITPEKPIAETHHVHRTSSQEKLYTAKKLMRKILDAHSTFTKETLDAIFKKHRHGNFGNLYEGYFSQDGTEERIAHYHHIILMIFCKQDKNKIECEINKLNLTEIKVIYESSTFSGDSMLSAAIASNSNDIVEMLLKYLAQKMPPDDVNKCLHGTRPYCRLLSSAIKHSPEMGGLILAHTTKLVAYPEHPTIAPPLTLAFKRGAGHEQVVNRLLEIFPYADFVTQKKDDNGIRVDYATLQGPDGEKLLNECEQFAKQHIKKHPKEETPEQEKPLSPPSIIARKQPLDTTPLEQDIPTAQALLPINGFLMLPGTSPLAGIFVSPNSFFSTDSNGQPITPNGFLVDPQYFVPSSALSQPYQGNFSPYVSPSYGGFFNRSSFDSIAQLACFPGLGIIF